MCLSSAVIDRQASNLKGSSTFPLNMSYWYLKPFEIHQNNTANYHNIHKESEWDTPGIRNRTLCSPRKLELSTSNESISVHSSPHRWSADAEQDSYISTSQRAITLSQCPKMHQKWDTLPMNWTSQSDIVSFRQMPNYLTQEVVPCLL